MKTPLILLLALLAIPSAAQEIPSPRDVLGFEVGAPGHLASWTQVRDYFTRLDAASERVRVEEVGRTTEGRPFLRVIVTSAANMSRLEEIRQDDLRLADPRGLSETDAAAIVERGKVVVGQFHGLHATEVAATLTAVELAHLLATTTDPALLDVLDRVVIVMLPCHNPDGLDLVEEWHRRTAETPYRGTAPPRLYQKYTGHDNNRDWYTFTQQETRLTVEHVYRPWPPQIVHDLHQMDGLGPRMFVPPYVDPYEPNVDPALQGALSALGTHVAARLTDQGKAGVVVQALFDAWTPARAYPHTHGGVRVLTETAAADLSDPLEVAPDALQPKRNYQPHERTWNQPRPWKGGTWSLRDAIDYQLAASLAVLDHAARDRRAWLQRFLDVNRRAAARTTPQAWALPATQHDGVALARLVETLRWGGVEVFRTAAPLVIEGQSLGAGSYLIPLQQPASAFAQTVLEEQDYPDLRLEDGTPMKPYDVTAHTLPLLMGVEARAVNTPVDVTGLEPVTTMAVPVLGGQVARGRGDWLTLPHTTGGVMAVVRLLRQGVDVRWARAAGTFLVSAGARRHVEPVARELGLAVGVQRSAGDAWRLRTPRVGIYQSWVPAIDEGWTRFMLEQQVGVEFKTLHDADVRAGDLAARFDVIVLPDQAREILADGHPRGTMPSEYTGGLGGTGITNLRRFVEQGGTLVALNDAARFAIHDLGVSVKDRLTAPGGERAEDIYCPGAILLGRATKGEPLLHGVDESLPLWFENSPAFDVSGSARSLVAYASSDPLLSGWLLGGARLEGASAMADAPLGRGHVVLFGFRPQYRGQSWGTYLPLLNALLLSAAR